MLEDALLLFRFQEEFACAGIDVDRAHLPEFAQLRQREGQRYAPENSVSGNDQFRLLSHQAGAQVGHHLKVYRVACILGAQVERCGQVQT